MKLGMVIWWDTHSSDEWIDKPETYTPVIVYSFGYLIELADGVIVLPNYIPIQDGYDSPKFYGKSEIPRGCIRKITYYDEERD